MTILAVAAGGILTSFSAAMVAAGVSEQFAEAANLGQVLRAQLRAGMFTPYSVNTGTFTEAEGYSYTVNFTPAGLETLYEAELLVQWTDGRSNRQLRLVTYHHYDEAALMAAEEGEGEGER